MRAATPEPADGSPGRRQFLAGALSLAAVATGCGSGAGTPEERNGKRGSPARIRHKYGVTEIPKPPDRVVTVGLTGQDYVLALGTAPVGVREWFGGHPGALWPWARDALGDKATPEVLPRKELDFEQIAALRPDLVLGLNSGLTRQEYRTLSKIAPTVAQPGEHPDYGIPWQEMSRVVGQALHRTDRAKRRVAEIKRRVEKARAHHRAFAKSTGLLATSIEGSAYVYTEGPAPRFLRSLGLTMPRAAAALFSGKERAPVQVSAERLDVLEADVLLLGLYGPAKSSIANTRLYQALDVAQEGRDVLLPEKSLLNGAVSFSSLLSLPIALGGLVPRIAAAIDGDPATEVKKVS